MVVGHYVDDFTGIENAHTAMSAFESFEEFNEILGATMKRAKRAPPVRALPLLGVILELGPDMVSVSPTPNRRHKLRSLCQKYLVANTLSPTDAGSLAGKATFFNTSCMGRVGRAAVSPVYARHHASHHVTTVTDSLRAALVTIARIATNALPRTLPLSTDWRPVPLVYADAFFNLGQRSIRQTDLAQNSVNSQDWKSLANSSNGFGVLVVPLSGTSVCFQGSMPTEFLSRFATRKQYIFLLEAVAQMLALFACGSMLSGPYYSFVDNTAAQFALVKGFTSDPAVNVLSSIFWATAAEIGAGPWFERVTSKANPADAISRGDCSHAVSMGVREICLDFTEVWPLFLSAVDSHSFADATIGIHIAQILQEQLGCKRRG